MELDGNAADVPVTPRPEGVSEEDLPGPDLLLDEIPDSNVVDQATGEIGTDLPVVPATEILCRPCRTDADCAVGGTTGNRCIERGADGRYCGTPCSESLPCPDGYQCTGTGVDLATSQQCQPGNGAQCPCSDTFKTLVTICYTSNEFGKCEAERTCDQSCPARVPAGETCNGQDDNCDGQVDEGLGSTTCGKGVCLHTVQNCAYGVLQTCDPLLGAGFETCNGKDDNCDGQTDEGLGSTTCGKGICTHTVLNCFNGQPQTCNPLEGASPEVCNGQDDDCDGQADEEMGSTTCGKGICVHTTQDCVNGVSLTCNPLEGSIAETCNGQDDNCDGQVDEGLGSTTCGKGVCLHTIQNCAYGVLQTCDPLQAAGVETCNGKDDNCDGQTDEGLGSTTCGKGICTHTVLNCFNGQPQTCNPLEGASPEVCNGQDDNCDGQADEGLGWTTCGKGICNQTIQNCVSGVSQTCDPLLGAGPEVCNGKDDNCDGQTDEGLCAKIDEIDMPYGIHDLAWGDGLLWAIGKPEGGTVTIYKIDTATKTIVGTIDTTSKSGYYKGLAFDQGSLWISLGGGAIRQIDQEGNTLTEVPAPQDGLLQLSLDGGFFWMSFSKYDTNRIYSMNKTSGASDLFYEGHDDFADPMGVEASSGQLWWTRTYKNKIELVDIATKKPIHSFFGPGVRPLGIAYTGDCLWISDWSTDKLYKIKVKPGCQ